MSQYTVCQYDITAVHQKLLEILTAVDGVCKKHGIRYTLEGGTLLGAVKYGGFVPWDDDIDIVMLRCDYEKFLRVCQTEMGADSKYFIQNFRTVRDFPLNYTKVCMNNTLYMQSAYANLDIHHGLFIDVFPIDNVRPRLFGLHCALIGALTGGRAKKLGIARAPKLRHKLISLLPLALINRAVDAVLTLFSGKDTEYVYELCNPNRVFKPLQRAVYTTLVEMDFMGRKFTASALHEVFLQARFGDIKRTPGSNERRPSHGIVKCSLDA